MRRIIFLRDYTAFSGGHLKVWHYFEHTLASGMFEPVVYFSERSRRDAGNPWAAAAHMAVWETRPEDVIFLGGNGWATFADQIAEVPHAPVLNIIQGLRHADPQQPLHRFLQRRAIRLCVNPLIHEALLPLRPSGALLSLPMGLDLPDLGGVEAGSAPPVLVAALKRPQQGRAIARELERRGHPVRLLEHALPRLDYLRLVAAAEVALFLPTRGEGFYLPALEAMALGTTVVCPDCIANRVYLAHGVNGFMPDDDEHSMIATIEQARAMGDAARAALREQARRTAARFSPAAERAAFLDVLARLDSLWREGANP